MNKENLVKFKDFAIVNPGQSPKSEFYSDSMGVPFLQGNRTFGLLYPTIDTFTTKVTKIAEEGEILMSVRAPVGDLNFAEEKVCIGRGVAGIKAKDGNNKFLFYCLKYNIKNLIRQGGGTTYDSVNKDLINDFQLIMPQLSISRKIVAKVLSDLDAKIDINNKINQELEAMAKTLYDYWFVQFDFPDANGKSYKSSGGEMVFNEELKREIPFGWEVADMLSLGNITTGRLDSNAEVEDGEYHFYTCAKTPSKTDSFAFDDSVILIAGNNAAGNFHVNRFTGKFNAYQRTYIITASDKKHLDYLYQVIKIQMKIYKTQGKGSQTKFLTIGMLNNISVFSPNANLMEEFSKKTIPMYKKQVNLMNENQKLSELRDWLLPMLMNGQVTVGEAEKEIENLGLVADSGEAYK